MFRWNKYPLLRFFPPFIGGILLAFLFHFPPFLIYFTVTILVVCVIFLCLIAIFKIQKQILKNVLGMFFIFSISLIYTDLHIKSAQPPAQLYQSCNNIFIGTITQTPSVSEKSVKLRIRLEKYRSNDTFFSCSTLANVYISRSPAAQNLKYGDKLIFKSNLQEISPPKNPYEFDYQRYLKVKSIYLYGFVANGRWQILSENNGNWLFRMASVLRGKMLNTLKKCNMSDGEYGATAAILLGYSESLDYYLQQSYANAGASHILCVSGMHLGIIYMIMSVLLGFLNKNKFQKILRTFLLLLIIWFYACLTGLSPSVLRAATMFTFMALAGIMERKSNSYNSLLVSMLVLLLIEPLLLFEVGFQLSYLAVFGIVWLQQRLDKLWTPKNKIVKYFWGIVTVSLAAQLFTAPLATFYFHQFPNYFLLTNLLIITLVPVIIGLGIVVLLSSFWLPLFTVFAFLLKFVVKIMNFTVTSIDALPFSVSENIPLSNGQMLFLYLIIILLSSACVYKKKDLLIFGCSFLALFLFTEIYNITKISQQEKIIFYSVDNQYYIDYIQGQKAICLADNFASIDPFSVEYSVKNCRIAHRINEIKYKEKANFVQFKNCNLLILDHPIRYRSDSQKIKTDFLLLSNREFYKPEDFLQNIDCKVVILDGSLSYNTAQKIKSVCNQRAIPVHDLKKEGAFVQNLK
ncbi:MAG: competence protein ComEC family protein [Bacteroidales bacterium]|jgi:competence protein ComEC|nr:competence protein ComEC family protein [Bacteroidales bacterium]